MIPPDADGEFVARMEDLLDLYAEPFSPARPSCPGETRMPMDATVPVADEPDRGRVGTTRPQAEMVAGPLRAP